MTLKELEKKLEQKKISIPLKRGDKFLGKSDNIIYKIIDIQKYSFKSTINIYTIINTHLEISPIIKTKKEYIYQLLLNDSWKRILYKYR